MVIPTIHCCRKHWKNGRSGYSVKCCPGSWISFTKSTPASFECGEAMARRYHRQSTMSIVERGSAAYRMAHLAIVGSFSVNGVAALHTRLLKEGYFATFANSGRAIQQQDQWVDAAPFLVQCNQGLNNLITGRLEQAGQPICNNCRDSVMRREDLGFRQHWLAVKQSTRNGLRSMVERQCGVRFDPDACSMFRSNASMNTNANAEYPACRPSV